MAGEVYARIRVRKAGKLLGFLTPRGGTNRLKVHATYLPVTDAENRIAQLKLDNPEYDFEVDRDKTA